MGWGLVDFRRRLSRLNVVFVKSWQNHNVKRLIKYTISAIAKFNKQILSGSSDLGQFNFFPSVTGTRHFLFVWPQEQFFAFAVVCLHRLCLAKNVLQH